MTSKEFEELLNKRLRLGKEALTDKENEDLEKKWEENKKLPSIAHETPVNGDYYGYLYLDVNSRE